MTFIFLVAYHFLFAMYSNLAYVTFIFYPSGIHFSFIAPVEGLCCKQKYRANIIHHFIFVLFHYFFYHSSRPKDQFTILSLKFVTQDFTDPGLLKIRRTLTGLSLWFCLHKCRWEKPLGRPLGIVSCHKYLGIFKQNDLQYGCNGIHKSERSNLKPQRS